LSIATFEALPKKLSAGDARALAVATKIRLARLYIEVGRRDWALTAVKEGLAIDPENKELLQLEAKL
jgi:endonuclease YncB( thermonuclease family)